MARLASIHRGEEKAFAILSDLRAMEGDLRTRLMQRWQQIFRKTRALWGEGGTRAETDLRGGRAHVLLENTFWLPAWITRYEVDEYPRVESAADGRVPPRHRHAGRCVETGNARPDA